MKKTMIVTGQVSKVEILGLVKVVQGNVSLAICSGYAPVNHVSWVQNHS